MNPWPAIQLSLLVAFVSSTLLLPIATLLGYWLQRGRLGVLARWCLSLPLSLPPLASGVLLLCLFSPLWPVGAWFAEHGMNPVLTWYGAVLASSLVALPLAVEAGEAAWQSFPEEMVWEARSLGAEPARAWREVGLPQVAPGLVRAWAVAFQRSLGEFGATLLVAGNIPGQTQTLPLALYVASESGNYGEAGRLLGWSLLLALLAASLVQWVRFRTP
ncbi:MAG: ABC transporter permease subunit [Candidatus Eremiobacteraeota bacterium]|nr:ABC transporter permease subunit [Candidatus Eremiobacteraeota bacterium]MCW5872943.1 ABC transporter permease subunit [Candidatus Eremiobacteraeota bacterium]